MSNDTIVKLNGLVADFTVFYQKLRHYHWNIKGDQFFMLHAKFEEMYTEVGTTIDELAERIIGLEGTPFHTLGKMLDEATINEDAELPPAKQMVTKTVEDVQKLLENVRAAIAVAEAADDRTTTNLLDAINDGLEAHLWMLKAWQK